MTYKLIKSIKIIAYIIAILFLISAIWYGWQNLNHVRKSTNELDKGINEIIIQDIASYDKDIKSLADSRKKLEESEVKIDKLIQEAETIIND